MLTSQIPQALREEFERRARLVYRRDGVTRALVEAIELWLAQHRPALLDGEQTANDETYERLRAELEREHWGKWVVIAEGALQGVGETLDEVASLAAAASDRIVVQIGDERPSEVELGWQSTFL